MQAIWEKVDVTQERLSQIQTDILNQLSFPHTNSSVLLLNSCCLADGIHFFSPHFFPCHSLIYNDTWQSCYAAFESTILVFQCCAILHPFPHINLSWAPFLTVVLICSQTMINMPLVSCDKILPISLHACLQLLPPYYFRKVALVTKLRLFHSLLYILCSTYPFLIQMCFVSRNEIWKWALVYVWGRFHDIL